MGVTSQDRTHFVLTVTKWNPDSYTDITCEHLRFTHLITRVLKDLSRNMSGDMKVCDIDPVLKETLKEFRFRKDNTKNAAVIMKVDRETHMVVIDQQLEVRGRLFGCLVFGLMLVV
ncbi:unnamed protein product [Allacma fusca]|uniref:Uncharacterized protein n=2 Tax=Allacma fusca TaxID=39272 RepID=A0A8J2LQZ7_9HEXA|nr:unnamed protein product [Allacma fusca]